MLLVSVSRETLTNNADARSILDNGELVRLSFRMDHYLTDCIQFRKILTLYHIEFCCFT